jgi:hypothetical protein
MQSFPRINWWHGDLRPYESVISFFARFCKKNGTSVYKSCEFFNISPYNIEQLTDDEIERIALVLNEDLSVAQTVFRPSVKLNARSHYGLTYIKLEANTLRYCEECAKHGYHSYLHEEVWLTKCPFHSIDLRTFVLDNKTGKILTRRLSVLKKVMESTCKNWPIATIDHFDLYKKDFFDVIVTWVKNANHTGTKFANEEIWTSNRTCFDGEGALNNVIARLNLIAPIPKTIRPFIIGTNEHWHMEIRRFSGEIKSELDCLNINTKFSPAFDIYKNVCSRSDDPPPYFDILLAAKKAIRERHSDCHCKWAVSGNGWSSYWIEVDPDQWPHWGCTCPYDIALNNLEAGWGCSELVISTRTSHRDFLQSMHYSGKLFDAGLIKFPEGKEKKTGIALSYYYSDWRHWIWSKESPLSDLFNAVCEFEIESEVSYLSKWLQNIDEGSMPGKDELPTCCVSLCETDKDLMLIKWVRQSNV